MRSTILALLFAICFVAATTGSGIVLGIALNKLDPQWLTVETQDGTVYLMGPGSDAAKLKLEGDVENCNLPLPSGRNMRHRRRNSTSLLPNNSQGLDAERSC